MHPMPHHYTVSAAAHSEGPVRLDSPGLAGIESAPPREFDGPGDRWSPETLLTAAVVDCFVLSFRAIARASKLEWLELACTTQGTLERVEGKNRFTKFLTAATLRVPAGTDPERARRLLEKAEEVCLIANSLSAERQLEARVEAA